MTTEPKKKVVLGRGRLATHTVDVPPEGEAIQAISRATVHTGWSAVEEARADGLLRSRIRQAELSPTWRCPEDCGGCPDRVSLHVKDPPEVQRSEAEWRDIIDRLVGLGVDYLMMIGGTIDRHALTVPLMQYIRSLPGSIDLGWFTDGILLHRWSDGRTNPLFERLIEDGGILEFSTHISADFVVPEGVAEEGPLLDPSLRWENARGGSRFYKSAYGLRLARNLIRRGARRVVLNTTIQPGNLDEVLPVYHHVAALQEYARSIGSATVVLHSVSPWVWRPHLARGDDPGNYAIESLLGPSHVDTLAHIGRTMVEDTWDRLARGVPRVAANSSGYLAGLSSFAVSQDVPYPHGSGMLAVTPDGTVRMDPVFASARALALARSPYGFRDRDLDFNPFVALSPPGGPVFENLLQTTRGDVAWR